MVAAAGAGDTVVLAAGYSNETATVTQTGMTVTGGATSTGISLVLGAGVATFVLGGTAPINVLDALDGDERLVRARFRHRHLDKIEHVPRLAQLT